MTINTIDEAIACAQAMEQLLEMLKLYNMAHNYSITFAEVERIVTGQRDCFEVVARKKIEELEKYYFTNE